MIKTLLLRGITSLTDGTTENIKLYLTQLVALDISECPLLNNKAFANLKGIVTLVTLILDKNMVQDSDASIFTNLPNIKTISMNSH